MKTVKEAYESGVCPDCGEDIPDDVESGDQCINCEHTFCNEQEID